MHTETKQEKNKRVHACHKLMMSQKTTEGGMGIYKRRSWKSKRVVQIGITEGLEQMVDSFSFITPLCNQSVPTERSRQTTSTVQHGKNGTPEGQQEAS